MMPVSCAAAQKQSAAEEWQALAQRMGCAHACGLSSPDGEYPQIADSLQPSLKHVPMHWTPTSADETRPLPQRVVIYNAAECLEQERVRVLSEHDVQAIMTHTGLCRDAAVLALNVQGSSTKALHWAKDVLSGGGCIADAAAECWTSMLQDAGISREDAEAALQHCDSRGRPALTWARYCNSVGSGAAREAQLLQRLPPHHSRWRIARQYNGSEMLSMASCFTESTSEWWLQYFYPTVQRIERVQNAVLLDAYNSFCTAQGIPEASDSMGYRGSLMFHGSSAEAISNIVAEGFKAECSRQVQKLIWVASRSSYSHTYSARAAVAALRAAQATAAATAKPAGAATSPTAAASAAGKPVAMSLQQSAAKRQAAEISCEYVMIAAMAAVAPEPTTQQPGVVPLQQRGSTATFADNAALYPAYVITYRTPEATAYY